MLIILALVRGPRDPVLGVEKPATERDVKGMTGGVGGRTGGRAGATAGSEARTEHLAALREARWGKRANLLLSEGKLVLGRSDSSFLSTLSSWGKIKIKISKTVLCFFAYFHQNNTKRLNILKIG